MALKSFASAANTKLLAFRFLAIFIGSCSGLLIVPQLGAEGRGTFALFTSWNLVAVQFLNFGLPMTHAYLTARNRRFVPGLLANMTFWLSLITFGLVLFWSLFAVTHGSDWKIWAACCLCAFMSFCTIGQGTLEGISQGLGDVLRLTMSDFGCRLTVLLGYGLLMAGHEVRALYCIAVYTAAIFGRMVYTYATLPADCRSPGRKSPRLIRYTWAFGPKYMVSGLFTIATVSLDVVLVDASLGHRAAGQYSLACTAAQMAYMPFELFFQIQFARLASLRDMSQRVSRFLYFAPWLVAGTLLGAAGLTVGAKALPLIFGRDFGPSVQLLPVMAVGYCCFVWLGALGQLVTSTSMTWGLTAISSVALLTMALSNATLLKSGGLTSAAAVYSVTRVVWLLSTLIYVIIFVARSQTKRSRSASSS